MRRFALLLAVLTALGAAVPAQAVTRTYSTGAIAHAVAPGAFGEQGVRILDRGPVSRVGVSFHVEAPDAGDVAISLVSASGRTVRLIDHRGGGGANFGSGKGCQGPYASLADDGFADLGEGDAPFTESVYLPEQRLARVSRENARGLWRLRIDNTRGSRRVTIRCFMLDVSRDIVEHRIVHQGRTVANLSFRERNFAYADVRLAVRRGGRAVLDLAVQSIACEGCPVDQLAFVDRDPLTVRDLDGDGEPEVLLDLFTGGAHCCSYTILLRYLAKERRYARRIGFWGNSAYNLLDLDRDGRPELVSSDDRFAYAFASYAASAEPVRIWRLEGGRLKDVTRSFPAVIRRQAGDLWASYVKERRSGDAEVRGVLAAWAADLALLGRADEALKRLDAVNRRGDLGQGRDSGGWPGGRFYLDKLRILLRVWGYTDGL